jgi:LysR family transcriptional regulator, cell division regulator
MQMDTSSLRIFCAVADVGSVNAAAEIVNSVPSNVSARIRRLEDEAGTPLFIRESRGMRLTMAGELLLDYAERILALTEEARAALAETTGDGGTLRLASMECTAAVRLPPLLTRYHAAWPRVTMSLITGTTGSITQMVVDRQVDCAFVAGPVAHERLAGEAVFVEELVLAVPASVQAPEEADLRTMLGFPAGCSYRAHTENWLRNRGRPPRAVMQFGTLDSLLGCVAAGMGVTLLPRTVIESPRWREAVRALSLTDVPARAETWLIHHRDTVPTRAMQRFRNMAKEAGTEAEAGLSN